MQTSAVENPFVILKNNTKGWWEICCKLLYSQFQAEDKAPNLIGYSIHARPCIKYEDFMGLGIRIHDGLKVLFIFLAPLATHSHHGLATASDRCLTFWVNP